MFETLLALPLSFWAVAALLLAGAFWAFGQVKNGSGLPALAVLGTVAAWYVGDAFYNDYANNHAQKFSPSTLDAAWWQVAWFLAAFIVLTSIAHRVGNGRLAQRGSGILKMLRSGPSQPLVQSNLNQLFWSCVTVWLVLTVIACIRLRGEIPYYFFPYLGERADPWGRGRIGQGFDALISLAGYLQMFVAMIFGVAAALAQDRRVRALALAGCFLAWPYFLFSGVRNYQLAVVMPAILAWAFIRLRFGWMGRVMVLAASFAVVYAWFAFIIANRSSGTITDAMRGEEGTSLKEAGAEAHHEGLNMYEELCWINTFIKNGSYRPNWGAEYFAEMVNPIPRSLWHGKPLIGIDYAIARGQGWDQADADSAGVAATISTGMIGQGVVNFGRIAGPAFAALLMSLWVAGLARLDLESQKVGRIPLFALGLILTFNMGRDITLIILYTFIFGSVIVWWLERHSGQPERREKSGERRAGRMEQKAEMLKTEMLTGGDHATTDNETTRQEEKAESGKQKAEMGNAEMLKTEKLKGETRLEGSQESEVSGQWSESGERPPTPSYGATRKAEDGRKSEIGNQKSEILNPKDGRRHPGFGWMHRSRTSAEAVPAAKATEDKS